MTKAYDIFTVDEGLDVVIECGAGRAVANGNVTHYVINESLIEDGVSERERQEIDTGKTFQRTIEGRGTFTFAPMEHIVPLDAFIRGSEEELRGGDAMQIAKQYGFDASPFDPNPAIVDGLKALQRLRQRKTSDLPVTEIKPMKPSDRGKKNSEGGGRQRKDEED